MPEKNSVTSRIQKKLLNPAHRGCCMEIKWKPSGGQVFWFVVAAVMFVNVFHPFLWGPDEPREAEIARQIYFNGNFVTPHFCSLPFVEKPPLYYDLVAGMFFLTGGPSAEAARFVSACLGLLMLAGVYALGARLFGKRCAAVSVLLLIGMPQFYRASHWILLDIGVGAFCTLALGCFTLYVCKEGEGGGRRLLTAFYLSLAAAFLTKSLIGVLSVGAVIGAFILIRRRWRLIGEFLFSPSIFCFLVPVLLWVWLFYRDGGIYYLHEHFVNNTVGRFLHKDLTLPGSPVLFSDVGNSSPWYFYLNRLPSMLGLSALLLPFAVGAAWSNGGVGGGTPSPAKKAPRRKKVLAFLFRDSGEAGAGEKDCFLILLLWLLLPPVLLSFSAIKEVTYVLPSQAAAALLIGVWLDRRVAREGEWAGAGILLGAVLCSCAIAPFSWTGYWIAMGLVLAAGAVRLLLSLHRRAPEKVLFAVLALVICGVVIGNTPQQIRRTRQNRKCFIELAGAVWQEVGPRRLAILGGDETLRGSIPFYGNRDVVAIPGEEKMMEAMRKDPELCVLIPKRRYKHAGNDQRFREALRGKRAHPLEFPRLVDSFILFLPR